MGDMLESIYMTVVSTVSLVGMFFILYLIMRATTSRWREFEALYPARDAGKPVFTEKAGAIRIAQPGFRFGHLSGDLKSRVYPPVTGLTFPVAPSRLPARPPITSWSDVTVYTIANITS